MKKNSTLYHKIMKYTIIIMIFSTLLATACSTLLNWNAIEREVETNIKNTANIVASNPLTAQALQTGEPLGTRATALQVNIGEVMDLTENINLIVVCDMNGIRYTHPDAYKIGKRMVGGDEVRVVQTGESYITTAVGTLGKARRAFAPVYNENNEQVGYVLVGIFTDRINEIKSNVVNMIIMVMFMLTGFGVLCSMLLSQRLKKDLLDHEPNELVNLYLQKLGILDAMNEGIVAINRQEEIILINSSAAKTIGIDAEKIMGKKLADVCPKSTLTDVLITGKPEYDVEFVLNETVCLSNNIPVNSEEFFYGAVSVFRDKSAVSRLAEELTGVNSIVDCLRANSHEFLNKLHIILGMLELGDVEQAKHYITEINHRQQQMLCGVIKVIEDPKVSGLILGKFSKCEELNIKLQMSSTSNLKLCDNKITSNALTTIIGNLLNNAIDAVRNTENPYIFFDIKDSEYGVSILVSDNGEGIKLENIDKIYGKGFTTKKEGFGVGLSMVNNIVNELGGDVSVETEVGEGTTFEVYIPRNGGR